MKGEKGNWGETERELRGTGRELVGIGRDWRKTGKSGENWRGDSGGLRGRGGLGGGS